MNGSMHISLSLSLSLTLLLDKKLQSRQNPGFTLATKSDSLIKLQDNLSGPRIQKTMRMSPLWIPSWFLPLFDASEDVGNFVLAVNLTGTKSLKLARNPNKSNWPCCATLDTKGQPDSETFSNRFSLITEFVYSDQFSVQENLFVHEILNRCMPIRMRLMVLPSLRKMTE